MKQRNILAVLLVAIICECGWVARMADLQQQIEAMEAQKVEIQAQIESIKLAIEEGKQNPEEEINEYSYYEEVYNALKEGLEKVKGYISGN